MMNASKPDEDLTAPVRDPRGDRLPADVSASAEALQVSQEHPAGQGSTPPEVWSQASRTASLAAPAATFGLRQDAPTPGSGDR